MATNKIGFPATDSYIMFAEESTFGTAIADNQNFHILQLVGNDVPAFIPNQYFDDTIKNRGKNIIASVDFYKSENGMFHSYSFPEFYANSQVLKHFLYGACQNVSEGSIAPYIATYTLDGTIKPDFSNNEGYFFTLLIKEPFASFSKKLTSCVFDELVIKISPDNGGRMILSGTIITGKGYTGTSNPSGTNTLNTTTIPNFFDQDAQYLTIGGRECIWYSAELHIKNTFDFTGYLAGLCQNLSLIRQQITANFTVKYDANTDDLLNSKGQDLGITQLIIGVGDAAGYFQFDSYHSLLRDISVERGGNDTVQKLNLTIEFANYYGTSNYIIFYCADNIDAGW